MTGSSPPDRPGSAEAEELVRGWARAAGVELPVHDPRAARVCPSCQKVPVPRLNAPCPACLERENRARWKKLFDAAWESVPDTLSWASFDSPHLRSRVWDGGATELARQATKQPLVTLVGEARAGKTSLAVCILREIVRAGASKGARFKDRVRASKVLFVTATDLVRAKSESRLGSEVPIIERAQAASVLVLDELGDIGPDPHRVIFALLHRRHREGAPTIVTTWMQQAQVAATYGGGIAGRLFEDGVVIAVRKRPAEEAAQ